MHANFLQGSAMSFAEIIQPQFFENSYRPLNMA
jgi:hypothetical protein